MDLRRANLPAFNPQKQKLQSVKQQRHIINSQPLGGSTESRMSKLQESISSYFDSIQSVCRAGLRLAEALSGLMNESPGDNIAEVMRSQFNAMDKMWMGKRDETKNELAKILMELSLPVGGETKSWQQQKNLHVLEKCIGCLAALHNVMFKTELEVVVPKQTLPPEAEKPPEPKPPNAPNHNNNSSSDSITFDLDTEWTKLRDVGKSVKSWFAMKESFSMLRKFVGLSEPEIRNLTKSSSDSLMRKLNQRIDSALKNYEVGLHTLPSEPVVVLGGLHIAPDRARVALRYCCSQMEVEQDTQRLPVGQFLHCELPLTPVIVHNKEIKSDPNQASSNINEKKNAVNRLIQATNQKLTLSESDELSSEILGEICPARWRTHVKAILQLLYGNSGLVVLDTVSGIVRRSATITTRDSYIVIVVPSEWCIKEDPGAMSLLKRDLDPEKQLGTVLVRYVAVYNTVAGGKDSKFEPGIFVETSLQQIQTQNKRSRSRSSQVTSQFDIMTSLSPLATCWVKDVGEVGSGDTELSSEMLAETQTVKKIVVEIKTEELQSDGEKSSDGESNVQDVIDLLSGGGCVRRHSSRKKERVQVKVKHQSPSPQRKAMKKVEEAIDNDAKTEDNNLKETNFSDSNNTDDNSPQARRLSPQQTTNQQQQQQQQPQSPVGQEVVLQNTKSQMNMQHQPRAILQHPNNLNSSQIIHKRSQSDIQLPYQQNVDSPPLMNNAAFTPPPSVPPPMLQRPQINVQIPPTPAGIARIRAQGFLPPNNMLPPPQQFHPLPSKPPANFPASNMSPYFPVNLNFQQHPPTFSPSGGNKPTYFPPQGSFQHPPGQMKPMESPKKELPFIPLEGFPPGHVQELSQYFAKLHMKHDDPTQQQMALMNVNHGQNNGVAMEQWDKDRNQDNGTLPRQQLPRSHAMIKQAQLLHHNNESQQRFDNLQQNAQKQNMVEEFNSAEFRSGLGPIGSPVQRRHVDAQQQSGCKTWPHYDHLAAVDTNNEEEYSRYVADITKNAMQRNVPERSATWGNANDRSGAGGFGMFSTPDLAKQIAGNRLKQITNENEQRRPTEENQSQSRHQNYDQWSSNNIWTIWSNSENDNSVNWSKDVSNLQGENN